MNTVSNTSPIYDIPLTTIDGTDSTLGDYKGKILLIVNLASRCGFTLNMKAWKICSKSMVLWDLQSAVFHPMIFCFKNPDAMRKYINSPKLDSTFRFQCILRLVYGDEKFTRYIAG